MAVSGRMLASPWAPMLSAVLALLLCTASTVSANGAKANPIGKVIELLKALHEQTQKDAIDSSEAYKASAKFFADEIEKNNKIIKDSTDTETDLKATLDQEKENRVKLSSQLEKHVSDVAKYENELASASATRKETRELYVQNEATYQQSIKQLDMAIEVMGKKMPSDSSGGAGSSLVEVAAQLQKTFKQGQGKDFILSSAQRETLRAFVEVAEEQAAADKSRAASAPRKSRSGQALTPEFLQVRQEPYGEYESTTTSLQGTLNNLLKKVKEEMEAAQTKEAGELEAFTTYSKELQGSISTSQQALDDTKTALASSQETSSQKEAELQEVQANLKAATTYLTELETNAASKETEYKAQTQKRSDELIALQEAQKLLYSETAQGLIGDQTIGTVSFMQLSQAKHSGAQRRAVKQLLQSATSPGLVLLAMKAHLKTRHSTSGPFDKVKGMVKDLLVKLQNEQSEEAKHKEWCDKEMGKSNQTLARQARERQTKTGRKVEAENQLEEVTNDIGTLTADTADMRQAMGTAAEQRIKDKTLAEKQIAKFKDGYALLTRAVEVLKSYYDKGSDDSDDEGIKNRKGAGQGVVAILEIAAEDFKELHEEAKLKEDTDSQEFNEFKLATSVKLKSFEKSLEYKNQEKTKLELYLSEVKQDLTELEKEATATESYVETLTQQCTIKAPTYEERETRRAAELESLKNALAILKGESY